MKNRTARQIFDYIYENGPAEQAPMNEGQIQQALRYAKEVGDAADTEMCMDSRLSIN